MIASIAPHATDGYPSGVPDSLLVAGTSRDVQQLLVVTDSVFITAVVTAGLLA